MIEDFNNDGKADTALFDPTTCKWYLPPHYKGIPYGGSSVGDLAVPADYDGDGKIDFGVFRSKQNLFDAQWLLLQHGALSTFHFGATGAGDLPVWGLHINSATIADIAIYRPSSSAYFYANVLTNARTGLSMGGSASSLPLPFRTPMMRISQGTVLLFGFGNKRQLVEKDSFCSALSTLLSEEGSRVECSDHPGLDTHMFALINDGDSSSTPSSDLATRVLAQSAEDWTQAGVVAPGSVELVTDPLADAALSQSSSPSSGHKPSIGLIILICVVVLAVILSISLAVVLVIILKRSEPKVSDNSKTDFGDYQAHNDA